MDTTSKRHLAGHLACAGAYIIFGLNIVMCKEIANSDAITPTMLFTMRAAGATALFWLLSAFMPHEKVARRDWIRIVAASLLGLFAPQMTFLVAITMTTSIDTSILSSFSPIMTMCIAALFLHEPITLKKASGVAMSFAGVMLLIFNSFHATGGVEQTKPLGVVLILMNCLTFALYLGAFRPLIARYSVVTFMKWSFLVSLLVSLPFSTKDFATAQWSDIPSNVVWEVAYVIFFATFVAYFLIPFGQKRIRPTLVSMYSYIQPMLAAVVSICIGQDTVTWQKITAALLVFSGVAVVNRSRAAKPN
ncbi:MAG: DMT family transporter [Bacteroidaceae bacterium]|nr:DMT family transporter [Bacteroidaceae bacterium]